jgi:hypothetical protein
MPVEAAVKDGMKGARALHVGIIRHDVIELVRIFARQMPERDTRKFRCQRVVEFDVFRLIHAHLAFALKPGILLSITR